MRSRLLLIFLLFISMEISVAQRCTISGILKDSTNGETLKNILVSLIPLDNPSQAYTAFTNQAGFYSVTVFKGKYIFQVLYLEYKTIADTIDIQQNTTYNCELVREIIRTDEVVISGKAVDHNVSSVQVGKMEMKIETIQSLPALFGEVDVLKSIQLLPGIQSGGEGNTGFYVRGGGADQNLILLDEMTIYNASHLFGFFSVFNSDIIKNVEVSKSGMPANYGGRLSSIVDITQKDGNMKGFQAEGGIGVVASHLTVQGPIKKDKCSFILSGRRTYIDWLIQPFLPKGNPLKNNKFYFYDLNAKLNIIINEKHRLFISGYYGNDNYGFSSTSGNTSIKFLWGNGACSMRWNYIIHPQLFLNTSFAFTNYNFSTKMIFNDYTLTLESGVRDYSLKSELTYLPSFPHEFKFGFQYIFHKCIPNKFNISSGSSSLKTPQNDPYFAHEIALYALDEFDLFPWWKVNIGIRYTHFEHIGKFTRNIIDKTGKKIDSIVYKAGKIIHQYNNVEPRLAMRFQVAKKTSIKISYTLNYQYIHQVSLANITMPTDVWIPSTNLIKPQQAHQVSLGIFQNIYHDMFEGYIDLYYKHMNHLIEYRDGINIQDVSQNADQMYVFGKGWSYGVEFFIKKSRGNFTGFIGYTLAFTKRQFPDLNNGKPFFAKYDRRHDVSINLSYEIIRNKLNVSAVWIFSSGNTMTLPIGLYFFNGSILTEYSERNAYRVPPYHRLDLSINWTICKKKHFETSLNLSVYNVYNRKNPFFIFFETTTNYVPNQSFDLKTTAYQMSLFPILPSLTWYFKIY